MKTLTLSFLAVFCALLSFGQNQSEPNSAASTEPTAHNSQMFLNSDFGTSASLDKMTTYSDFASFARREEGNDEGKCEKFKKLKKTGIIVVGVGGGMFVVGVVMMAVGFHDLTNYNSYYATNGVYGGYNGAGLYVGGALLTTFGVLGAGAGTALLVIGSVKSKRYCGGGRRSMDIGTNGTNLALNF